MITRALSGFVACFGAVFTYCGSPVFHSEAHSRGIGAKDPSVLRRRLGDAWLVSAFPGRGYEADLCSWNEHSSRIETKIRRVLGTSAQDLNINC